MCVRSVCGETVNHQLDNDTVCMQIMATRYTHAHLLCADLDCMGNDRLAISTLSGCRNENSCEKAQKKTHTLKMFLSWGDFCFRFSRFSETNRQINTMFCHRSTILVSVPRNSSHLLSFSCVTVLKVFGKSNSLKILLNLGIYCSPDGHNCCIPHLEHSVSLFPQGSLGPGNGHISDTQMTFWRPHLQCCIHYFLTL